jgi:hypothetical protein
MSGIRSSVDVIRSRKSSSERARKARLEIHTRRPVHEGNLLKKSESSYADDIRVLCSDGFTGTADRMTATAALGSVEKVISAEVYLKDAAISLAQEEKLSSLLDEMHDVADALGLCQGPSASGSSRPSSAGLDEMRPALPNWWFALSEMLQVCESEIEFVASIGRGQRRDEPVRQLCNTVVRVLRKHYHEMLGEAQEWMDMTDA